jgi:HSP20 family protein
VSDPQPSREGPRPEGASPDESLFTDLADWPWRSAMRATTWRPPADVYETAQAIIVRVEIAGMRVEDFNIALDGRSLVIRGLRSDLNERRAFHQMEIRFGEFSIEIELPVSVNENEVQAFYANGFLRLVLPKATSRQVSIQE